MEINSSEHEKSVRLHSNGCRRRQTCCGRRNWLSVGMKVRTAHGSHCSPLLDTPPCLDNTHSNDDENDSKQNQQYHLEFLGSQA